MCEEWKETEKEEDERRKKTKVKKEDMKVMNYKKDENNNLTLLKSVTNLPSSMASPMQLARNGPVRHKKHFIIYSTSKGSMNRTGILNVHIVTEHHMKYNANKY